MTVDMSKYAPISDRPLTTPYAHDMPDLTNVDWNGNKQDRVMPLTTPKSYWADPKRKSAGSGQSEAAFRKEHPMATGVLDYFPDALMEVAHLSWVATQQHHPGSPMHWDRDKSPDHADSLLRHLKDRGTRDTDGERHWAKVAWRALAGLQTEIENERKTGYINPTTT